MPTSAVSHAQTRARPDRKKARQSARQSVASSTTAVTQRELPSVGVGPGRKPSTAHSIPGGSRAWGWDFCWRCVVLRFLRPSELRI